MKIQENVIPTFLQRLLHRKDIYKEELCRRSNYTHSNKHPSTHGFSHTQISSQTLFGNKNNTKMSKVSLK